MTSSHIRNAVFYVFVTSLMLVFLNVYSATTTRDLIYSAKEASLQDKAQLIASSFSGMDTLNTENTAQVISVLGELNVARVVITDGEGRSLYDSLTKRSSVGQYVLLRETAEALRGQDVMYSEYREGQLISHAAMPIMAYNSPIGCVYIADLDPDQGAIIKALEVNIVRISVAVEIVLLMISVLFAMTSSAKMRQIFSSMQKAREGEYSHKLQVHGSDEYAVLGLEFNKLTDRLQASEQAQRQFVSDASHELKTPLASIKLLSDSILQNDMDAETMREFVSDIGNEADRLTRLAQDLLSISKAEVVRHDHEVVDLAQTISKVFKMLVALADIRSIRLTCTMEKDCTVMTVEDDMYQIIFNLVENGIKYNHDNGEVHVDLRKQEDDVVITVEDTGIGIPEDARPFIFERFYRVDKARSREAGGSGLGLSIVRELVLRNYGQISVAPRAERGTCFTVTFPRFDVEVEQ